MSTLKHLPNLITLCGLAAGIVALMFAINGNYFMALSLVLLAAVCDVLDGFAARILHAQSPTGEMLDSLCDGINFGVVPVVILALWANIPEIYWPVAALFSLACVYRLARFTVDKENQKKPYFIGLPAPAAGIYAFLPFVASYAWPEHTAMFQTATLPFCLILSVLMVGTRPVFSLKGPIKKLLNTPYMWAFLGAMCLGLLYLPLWQGVTVMGGICFIASFVLGHISRKIMC